MLLAPHRSLLQMNLSLASSNLSPQPQLSQILTQSDMVSATSVTWSHEQRAAQDRASYPKPQDPTTKLQSGRKRRATSPALPLLQNVAGHAAAVRHHSAAASRISPTFDLPRGPKPQSGVATSLAGINDAMNTNLDIEHVVALSSIEQCMPRAYIRVCLTYRLHDRQRDEAVSGLNAFIQRTIAAKPYLAGYVVPKDGSTRSDPVEIRFSTRDYIAYPPVAKSELVDEIGRLMKYDDLDQLGFPPSKLHPEKVAMLPATMADQLKAPVFRVQANFVEGGIVVSLYLHHCISDGTGLGLLTTGRMDLDEHTFTRYLDGQEDDLGALQRRLATFAEQQSAIRTSLSDSSSCNSSSRNLLFKRLGGHSTPAPTNPPGRGCVISFPYAIIEGLRDKLTLHTKGVKFSRHDTLQALIWCHMVRARSAVMANNPGVKNSKLLIPVNIRNRVANKLPASYFGAAVDFAAAELNVQSLMQGDIATLSEAAKTINHAISLVDDAHIRQTIALANDGDPTIDVRDLLASNMNRVTGADMYITSWDRLGLYDSDLGLGLGNPDWVRKPWSRDPGSCIILPRNKNKEHFEVVIQMTQADMSALLHDQDFVRYVSRVID